MSRPNNSDRKPDAAISPMEAQDEHKATTDKAVRRQMRTGPDHPGTTTSDKGEDA